MPESFDTLFNTYELGNDLYNRISFVHDKGETAFGVASISHLRCLVPRTKFVPLKNFVALDISLESYFATGNRAGVRVELVLQRRVVGGSWGGGRRRFKRTRLDKPIINLCVSWLFFFWYTSFSFHSFLSFKVEIQPNSKQKKGKSSSRHLLSNTLFWS